MEKTTADSELRII